MPSGFHAIANHVANRLHLFKASARPNLPGCEQYQRGPLDIVESHCTVPVTARNSNNCCLYQSADEFDPSGNALCASFWVITPRRIIVKSAVRHPRYFALVGTP